MEKWKKFRDTNYEVSNMGRIRNTKTEYVLKPYQKYSGKKENDYLKISLNINKKKKVMSVHRMVAECFLKDYNGELEVNHKNTKRYDNRASNLEMTTKEENYQHSITHGKGCPRKSVSAANISVEKKFKSLWEAAKYIKETQNKDIDLNHICTNIKRGLAGKCKSYGYRWEYID